MFALASLLVQQWWTFLTSTKRAPSFVTAAIQIGAITVCICAVIAVGLAKRSALLTGFALIITFPLLIGDFSLTYWNYGLKPSFSANLSHLDAVYFAIGTLSTAGTGSLTALSEAARGIQTAQMTLDLCLLLFGAGIAIARLSDITK